MNVGMDKALRVLLVLVLATGLTACAKKKVVPQAGGGPSGYGTGDMGGPGAGGAPACSAEGPPGRSGLFPEMPLPPVWWGSVWNF